MSRQNHRTQAIIPALAAAAIFVLGACSPGLTTHGNLPDQQLIEDIRPGVHSQEDVLDILGSPSTVSTFQENRWYYIGSRSENLAIFGREVLERNVLEVSFSDDGLVGEMKTYKLNDGQQIEPTERVTPTEGKKLTIIQQLFGNVGRFGNEVPQRR